MIDSLVSCTKSDFNVHFVCRSHGQVCSICHSYESNPGSLRRIQRSTNIINLKFIQLEMKLVYRKFSNKEDYFADYLVDTFNEFILFG